MTHLEDDGAQRGPDLPDDVLPEGEDWHPATVRWWDTWRLSPQAQQFTDTDWQFLLDTALMHHAMWSKGRWEYACELRLRSAKCHPGGSDAVEADGAYRRGWPAGVGRVQQRGQHGGESP